MEIEFLQHRHPAIYKITNLINSKCYIGSAIDVAMRIANHKSKLKLNRHPNKFLQDACNKYNIINFKFEILECISDETKLIIREQLWINYFNSHNNKFGYNLRKNAYNNLGIKKPHSQETKTKIGAANSISQLGKFHSEETKAKMSAAKKGKVKSEETKANMRLAWLIRRETYGSNGRAS
jgi:group I intron endonuclease